MIEKDSRFLIEVWTLYAIGSSLLFTRFGVRLRLVGFKGLKGDDFFAAAVLVFYTLDALLVHITYNDGTNLDFSQAEISRMTQSEIDRVTFGSKMQLFAWYSYTALIWSLKGTMLCFFHRLTFGTWQQKLIKYISYACAVSYIAVFCTISAGCRPYWHNWQVNPLPQAECTAKQQNLITTAVFNVITDAMLLTIPLPLLWKLKVPARQKLVIAILLSSGVFVITAAILRVVFSVVPNPSIIVVNSWGVRETIVGIISVNIPILRPLFRRDFWSRGRTLPSAGIKSSGGYHGMSSSKQAKSGRNSSRMIEDNDSSDFIVGNKNDIVMETTIEIRRTDNLAENGTVPAATSEWKYGGGGGGSSSNERVEARNAV